MKANNSKTKDQLLEELMTLRKRVVELEQRETEHKKVEEEK